MQPVQFETSCSDQHEMQSVQRAARQTRPNTVRESRRLYREDGRSVSFFGLPLGNGIVQRPDLLRHTVLDLQEACRRYQVFDAGKLDRTDNGIEPTVSDGIAQLLSIKTGYLYGIGQYLERVRTPRCCRDNPAAP